MISDEPGIRTVHVELGSRAYDILIGGGLLASAGDALARCFPGARAAIVTDENVAARHAATLKQSLEGAGMATATITIAPGERSKSFAVLEQVVDEVLAARLERMPNLEEVIWCQEEPKNNGAWFFVESQIEAALDEAGHEGMRPRYAGREVAASPATGLAQRHQVQQEALVSIALGLADGGEILRNTKPRGRKSAPRKKQA